MGQHISRRIAGSLENGLQRARKQMDDQMRGSIVKDKYGFSDPNAAIGFTRGRDKAAARVAAGEESQEPYPEMHPDLIKFLNDVGPLERKVDMAFTSPRLRESLQIQELERRRQEQDTRRTVSDMPLMGEGLDHVTKRTTNFSNIAKVEDITFGLTGVQMYEMLAQNKSNEGFWEEFQLRDHHDKDAQFQLIDACRKYLELPVILKDENKEYLGLSASKAATMNLASLGMKPATGVKLVLSHLLDQDNERQIKTETVS